MAVSAMVLLVVLLCSLADVASAHAASADTRALSLEKKAEKELDACSWAEACATLTQLVALRSGGSKEKLADAHMLLANAYRQAGRFSECQRHLDSARQLLGDAAKAASSAAGRWSAFYNYCSLLENNTGNFSKAESDARQALELARTAKLGSEAEAMQAVVLANALRQEGQYTEALTVLEPAVKSLAMATHVQSQRLRATATNNLGALYFWLGDYAQAIPILEDGLKQRLALYPADHPDVANSYLDLGACEFKSGDLVKAKDHLARSLKIRQLRLGLAHPETLASEATLAVLLDAQGDFANAAQLLAHTVPAATKALGADHPDLAQYKDDYANVLSEQGRLLQARREIEDAQAIRARVFGNKSTEYAGGLKSFGQIELAANKSSEAASHLQAAAGLYAEKLSANPRLVRKQDYAETLSLLGAAYAGSQQWEPAATALARATKLYDDCPPSLTAAITAANWSEILQKLGKPEQARQALEQSIKVLDGCAGPERESAEAAQIRRTYARLKGSQEKSN